MRPLSRRRPAGRPQVPKPPPPPPPPVAWPAPLDPAVVRLGPDRVVIDAPWGLRVHAWSHVWTDTAVAGGWQRLPWPVDPRVGLAVAPVDLSVGHALEILSDGRALYGWVADSTADRFVLMPTPDARTAVHAGRRAFELYRDAELARVRQEWRRRFDDLRNVD